MQHDKLGTMPMGKLLFTMSGPIIISMVIQALYNIVDSMFVARYSQEALDAVSLCYPIQMLIIAVSVGCALAVQALLARALGSHEVHKASSIVTHGILIAITNSIIFALFGLFGSKFFLSLFSNSQSIIDQGTVYMQICTIFSFGVFIQITYERIMQASGNPIYNMIIQGIGAITNIILDPIFIFGYFGLPALGITGAAIATIIGQILGMTLGIIITTKKVAQAKFNLKGFQFDTVLLKQMFKIAIPAILMNSIMSIMTVFMNMILVPYSTLAVSVYSIYFKLQQFLYMAVNGLSNAVIAIISYNYGARNKERVNACIKMSLLISIVIMVLGTIVFECFPTQLLLLFNADQAMLDIGIIALKVISTSFVFGGISVMICSILQSLDGSHQSLIISLLRQLIIIIPLAFVLSKMYGLNALWLAFPITEIISCMLSFYFLKVQKKAVVEKL